MPFASNALGRLSQRSVYFVTFNITPAFIQPASPIKTVGTRACTAPLNEEPQSHLEPPCPPSKRAFNPFRRVYNQARPHELSISRVFFGSVHLGWLDERDFRIMDVTGRKRRR
ncbi:MAG TPA: hypothetical protein VMM83_07990 [Longimicrobiales bacterium]|nr:hypothetical protein [Longimicrobiales bacterium]